MIVLAIDSSSSAACAAVVADGKLLCEYTQNQNKTHSVKMLPMVEQMLSDVGLTFADVDVFACGIGPGSFTGVRIGAATLRGIADTLDKPCVAVNALEALGSAVRVFCGTVMSLIFARENECYAAAYEGGMEILAPCVMTVEDIIEFAKDKNVLFVGDGVDANRERLENLPNAHFADSLHSIIRASVIADIAYNKALQNETGNSEVFAPLYLRKSQAEREYDEKHKSEEK